MKSKDTIAAEMYEGCDFDELEGGEKAAVTKRYNKQSKRTGSGRARAGFLKVTIGRVADNGSETCLVPKGSTVEDLIAQAKLTLDEDKETVVAESTGNEVELDDKVVNGETYAISVEIESAEEEEEETDGDDENKDDAPVEEKKDLF